MDTYHKGDRVQVTGEGRTARWPRSRRGTVVSLWRDGVTVKWDHLAFTLDDMNLNEVKKVSHVS